MVLFSLFFKEKKNVSQIHPQPKPNAIFLCVVTAGLGVSLRPLELKAKALISCAKAPSIVCAMCKACAQFSWFLELRSSTSCSRNRRKTPHVMADSRGCLLHRCMKEAKGKWHRIFCKVCNLVQGCVTAYGRNVVKTQPYAPLWVTDIVRVTDSP